MYIIHHTPNQIMERLIVKPIALTKPPARCNVKSKRSEVNFLLLCSPLSFTIILKLKCGETNTVVFMLFFFCFFY